MTERKLTSNDISYLAKHHKNSELGQEIQSHIGMRHRALSEDFSKYDPNEKRSITKWVEEYPKIAELFS